MSIKILGSVKTETVTALFSKATPSSGQHEPLEPSPCHWLCRHILAPGLEHSPQGAAAGKVGAPSTQAALGTEGVSEDTAGCLLPPDPFPKYRPGTGKTTIPVSLPVGNNTDFSQVFISMDTLGRLSRNFYFTSSAFRWVTHPRCLPGAAEPWGNWPAPGLGTASCTLQVFIGLTTPLFPVKGSLDLQCLSRGEEILAGPECAAAKSQEVGSDAAGKTLRVN